MNIVAGNLNRHRYNQWQQKGILKFEDISCLFSKSTIFLQYIISFFSDMLHANFFFAHCCNIVSDFFLGATRKEYYFANEYFVFFPFIRSPTTMCQGTTQKILRHVIKKKPSFEKMIKIFEKTLWEKSSKGFGFKSAVHVKILASRHVWLGFVCEKLAKKCCSVQLRVFAQKNGV